MSVFPQTATDAKARSPAESAADWDARLRSPACRDADRKAFAAWRAADPAHAAAFDALQTGLAGLQGAYASNPELRAMRDRALGMRPRQRPWLIAAGVAAVIAVGVFGAWRWGPPRAAERLPAMELAGKAGSVFETGVGERTVITLSDGSIITLNTRSRLAVNFSAERRDVTLVAGQALFEVAKDPKRPFVATAGSRRVTAVGTAFDIRLDAREVQVTLVEGKVKVEPTERSVLEAVLSTERQLTAGQKLVASNQSPLVEVAKADLDAATSWRDGRVVFEDTPLTAAVAEMNRYSVTPILIGDPALTRFRVNGMFRTSEPLSFVSAIVAYFPVDAHANADGATVLTPRGT